MTQAGAPRPLFQADELARRVAALDSAHDARHVAEHLSAVVGQLHAFAEVDGDPEREDQVLTEEFARDLDLSLTLLLTLLEREEGRQAALERDEGRQAAPGIVPDPAALRAPAEHLRGSVRRWVGGRPASPTLRRELADALASLETHIERSRGPTLDGEEAQRLMAAADRFEADGLVDAAVAELQRAAAAHGHAHRCWMRIAHLERARGRFDPAVDALLHAAHSGHSPLDRRIAEYEIGDVYEAAGRTEQAAVYFERVVRAGVDLTDARGSARNRLARIRGDDPPDEIA